MGSINAILETHDKHRRNEQVYKIEHFHLKRIYVPLNLSPLIAYTKFYHLDYMENAKILLKEMLHIL